ncbi:unnamed protein product [Effrenium voratum]|nr:unnamed protein product [Effrenium voratum]
MLSLAARKFHESGAWRTRVASQSNQDVSRRPRLFGLVGPEDQFEVFEDFMGKVEMYPEQFEKLIEFRRADLDQSEATKDVIETMSPMADDGTPEVHESKSCAGSLMSLHNMRYCQRRLVCL